LCGVAAAAYFSARAFPLHAAYQSASAVANPRSDAPLRVKDVDLGPKIIFKREPSYPQQAKNSKTQGTVVLQIVIGKSGTVEQVERHRGDPVLAAAAEAAVRQWKFAPAMRQGAPVRVFADVEVNFTLSE
jgi:TonB family protein